MRYDRTIIGYHGCEAGVARRLLAGGRFRASTNDFDWLGTGFYFWEYGAERALAFAAEQIRRRRRRARPAVVGAIVQLGNCFDLLDVRATDKLARAYSAWRVVTASCDGALPANAGGPPWFPLRKLDRAVLNWFLDRSEARRGRYDTVRAAFLEGTPVFDGSAILRETHIQIAVRNPGCILGVFRPTL